MYSTLFIFSVATTGRRETEKPILRKFLLDGDYFVASALGTILVKLVLHYQRYVKDPKKQNNFAAEGMFIMASIIHLGKSGKRR